MRAWWWLPAVWLCTGCVVVVSGTPAPTASPAVSVATRVDTQAEANTAPAPTAGPTATESPLQIVTSTPSLTPSPAPATATATATPTPSATSSPLPSLTPPPSATATFGVPPDTTAAPIGITLFTIAPAQVRPGEAVTLTWQATAQVLTLWRVAADGHLTDQLTVPLSSTVTLMVPVEQRGRADFALVASAGASTAQAVVSVRLLCPADWFFANGPAECPAGAARSTGMAAQRFERGLMLWTQFDDQIYLLYGDGAAPAWHATANAWFNGQPLDDPALVPPAGYYQPVRGFGLAWRTGPLTGSLTPRDRLGWGIEPEFGIEAGQVQCAEAPNATRCYLTGPARGA
jgi:hypothetical protein